MKQKIILLSIGLSWAALTAQAAQNNGYSMTAPLTFPIYNSDSPENWASSNNQSAELISGGSALQKDGNYPNSGSGYQLRESQIGSPIEHLKAEYYLGDAVVPPEDPSPDSIDWDATWAELNTTNYNQNAAFYAISDGQPAIYFSEGGAIAIPWIYNNGSTNSHTYQVSAVGSSKPYRIFWTDEPYNAPQVDLSGKFVQFFGNQDILQCTSTNVMETIGGIPNEVTRITRGLFLDSSTHWLQALGEIEGHVVMAYYRTGSFDDLLGTIVIEVCEPEIETAIADIGSTLLPTGDGYDIDNLTALITAGLTDDDGMGAYIYQHKGAHSYSPKDGDIFAIRKTTGESWKIELYWEEADLMGTSWPFEILHYDCDWPADAETFVRGNIDGDTGLTIPIPDNYIAELQEFQEPAGHAVLNTNDTFYTTETGHSLLKLTGTDVNGEDNVWFQPVHSILRNDSSFDLTPNEWPVATEVTPLATSIALDFEGDAYVNTEITNLNSSFTIEAWVYYTNSDHPDSEQIFSATKDPALNGWQYFDFLLETQADTGKLVATMGSGNATNHYSAWINGPALKKGAWTHVALSYDSANTNLMLGINGDEWSGTQPNLTERQHGTNSPVILGAYYMNNTYSGNFSGKIDDIRIWNAVRSQEEILANMNGFLHTKDDETDLIAYYPIENTIGRVLQDHSGNEYNAPVVNASRTSPGAVGLTDLLGFSSQHAYIYEPVSGDNYNTNLYMRPDTMTSSDDPSAVNSISDGSALSDDETYLFAVNESGEKPLEVWWSHEVDQADMPTPLWFPAWVQQYTFHWPEDQFSTSEIVLCSQLGSASQSTVLSGVSLDFSASAKSYMQVPENDWFSGSAYTVEFWIKPNSIENEWSRIFDFHKENSHENSILGCFFGTGSGNEQVFSFESYDAAGNAYTIHTDTPLKLGEWSHLALSVQSGTATVFLNDKIVNQASGFPQINMDLPNNFIGECSDGNASGAFDGQIDEFRIWSVARTQEEIQSSMFTQPEATETGLRLYYDFDSDMRGTTDARHAYDRVNNTRAYIKYASWSIPGAPQLDTGILEVADGDAPFIYYQNDNSEAGYNPNEEHAFIQASESGYVTYALRCDLNVTNSSAPYVLVQYNDPANEGCPNMQLYHVVATNSVYTEFADSMTAGTLIPGPHPLDYLPEPWTAFTYWETNGYPTVTYPIVINDCWSDQNGEDHTETTTNWTETTAFSCPGYRDRKGQIWAKNAQVDGTAEQLHMHNYYPQQEGFYFPSIEQQPELGTPIPWLASLDTLNSNAVASAAATSDEADPILWTWTVEWPEVTATLDIGQTLTTAINDLPEVWNAQSICVIHEPVKDAAALYDPTVIQSVDIATEGNFMSAYGFDYANNAYTRNGYTYFYGTPPNVSGRFYFDPADSKLKLKGEQVDHEGGLDYLQLNVLNAEERTALINLVDRENENFSAWETAITALATNRVITADLNTLSEESSYEDTKQEEVTRYFTYYGIYGVQLVPYTTIDDYVETIQRTTTTPIFNTFPTDHYALTHMGLTNGYYTLIENDARDDACGVDDGDPITMHIIQLSDQLYSGSLLAQEDSNNLLSEQLDMLYTESFAGDADDFEFEWKKTEPNENGTTPTDYEHQYSTYRREDGLTRFTIGKQGDTLDNMVNNFYAMRYRATTNSTAYALTGGAWSDWCGPALAEGWVQRCLNNVTPFTQRMQDMYSNSAETTLSMIQQAGGPYIGDVALNQDNLNEVGLIQLYQTILNTAESMSIRLGIMNTAANQQLMEAATRLNDLYMLLGNEAYADALDPTIGFGSDFVSTFDYGSLHSSLFCFDNLVPNLRDEELALLRGRSDYLAPSIQLKPTYNRLYWNFTKGITAGEVAYAVNYQIQGSAATIDQPQAAVLFPMGHGDAWGHYLSALNGYYRLMRNPYFSWGTPSITALMVGDAVVDADYYDEEKFAESAAAMARTGAEIVKRTSEKSFLENDGSPLSGYCDEDPDRAAGYGEWGARAGLASLYNWFSANSLLPAETDPTAMDFMSFTNETQLLCEDVPTTIDFTESFTIEFKLNPDSTTKDSGNDCYLFDWHPADGSRSDAGAVSVFLNASSEKLHLHLQGITNNLYMAAPLFDQWNHIAISYDAGTRVVHFYLNGVLDTLCTQNTNIIIPDEMQLASPTMILSANDSPDDLIGSIAEFRIWNTVRSANELQTYADGVDATTDGLLVYQRFIGDANQGGYLPDEANGSTWLAQSPNWQEQSTANASIDFCDDSILRINRSSVGSLEELPAAMQAIQRCVDEADAGMTPIGLSDNAIPFDIDPTELAAGKGHFEQILARAETALGNAEALLDRAQSATRLLRQQQQGEYSTKENLANEEAAFNTQLIGIFGYPYATDIGSGGTYAQGYSGPDLYHYMWMDLEQYGFSDFELEAVDVIEYKMSADLLKENSSETLTFDLSANGLIIKPEYITGSRQAQGRLQAAYGNFIAAYQARKKAIESYDEKVEYLEKEQNWLIAKASVIGVLESLETIMSGTLAGLQIAEAAELSGLYSEMFAKGVSSEAIAASETAVPSVIVAGLSIGTDIGAPIKGAMALGALAENTAVDAGILATKISIASTKATKEALELSLETANKLANLTFEEHAIQAELESLCMGVNDAALSVNMAHASLINAQEAYLTVLAEGESLLAKRERLRKQAVNRIASGRYHDMAFRTFRNDALAKYSNAFDLAKKYTYLATKAYDYETALNLDDVYEPGSIYREIIGTRSIGHLDDDGIPQLGGLQGDGGLADILARLKNNWLVLEPRLGINNAQIERKWVSLRQECFRIPPSGSSAAQTWQNTLSSYRVDDLLDHPDFRHYCLPFNSDMGLNGMEPGLVIPFQTTIDFAQNLFGNPLAANDHAFDSSHYATKIKKVGVKFVGYNLTVDSDSAVALSTEPRVYLIPIGADVMRSPGSDGGESFAYSVVDQVIPSPFPLAGENLTEQDWTALYDAYVGNGDPLATIRRYPSLHAYHDQTSFEDDMISSTRLVGRSVWNTKWLLIIPAGSLHNDRDFALDTLIKGADLDKNGTWDQLGIEDIEIGFETYSNAGN